MISEIVAFAILQLRSLVHRGWHACNPQFPIDLFLFVMTIITKHPIHIMSVKMLICIKFFETFRSLWISSNASRNWSLDHHVPRMYFQDSRWQLYFSYHQNKHRHLELTLVNDVIERFIEGQGKHDCKLELIPKNVFEIWSETAGYDISQFVWSYSIFEKYQDTEALINFKAIKYYPYFQIQSNIQISITCIYYKSAMVTLILLLCVAITQRYLWYYHSKWGAALVRAQALSDNHPRTFDGVF